MSFRRTPKLATAMRIIDIADDLSLYNAATTGVRESKKTPPGKARGRLGPGGFVTFVHPEMQHEQQDADEGVEQRGAREQGVGPVRRGSAVGAGAAGAGARVQVELRAHHELHCAQPHACVSRWTITFARRICGVSGRRLAQRRVGPRTELVKVDAAVAVRVAEGDDLPHLRPEQREAHPCEGIEQLVLVQLPAAVLVDRLPSIQREDLLEASSSIPSAAVGRQEAQA